MQSIGKSLMSPALVIALSILTIYTCSVGIKIHNNCKDTKADTRFNITALRTGIGIGTGMLATFLLEQFVSKMPRFTSTILPMVMAAILIFCGAIMLSTMPDLKKRDYGHVILGLGIGYAIGSLIPMFTSRLPLTMQIRIYALIMCLAIGFLGGVSLNTYFKCGGQKDDSKINRNTSWILTITGSVVFVLIIISFIYAPA